VCAALMPFSSTRGIPRRRYASRPRNANNVILDEKANPETHRSRFGNSPGYPVTCSGVTEDEDSPGDEESARRPACTVSLAKPCRNHELISDRFRFTTAECLFQQRSVCFLNTNKPCAFGLIDVVVDDSFPAGDGKRVEDAIFHLLCYCKASWRTAPSKSWRASSPCFLPE